MNPCSRRNQSTENGSRSNIVNIKKRGRGCLLLLLNYGNHYLITYNGIQLYGPPATGGEELWVGGNLKIRES